ncbi:DUF4286 family protein [Maribacter antarcticus]|uniref:DUF4286 family protein n=1 Tax=Maribacter antarcticus TaxID=505250 RepID=UPI000A009299|nr:DUF4286 family protein [Maribacter antarcticus]
MYIYNVTTNIEESVQKKWVQWMKEKHIPDVLNTGKFINAKMSKVLVEEDMGGVTYSVQFSAATKALLEKYYQEDAPRLRKEANNLFAGKFVAFRTEMKVVDEQHVMRPSATHYLFTYGTLQEEAVQLGVFSRLLPGIQDTLINYKIAVQKVANRYPTLEYTNNMKDKIIGKMYTLSPEELEKADTYEGEAYERIKITLVSGNKAWAYQAKTS